nr:MAG TPA: hypothetical protein [Caudoviricetes sp.]
MLITNIEELEKKKKVKTYSCGSQRQSHEIRTKLGMVPIKVYQHSQTGKYINVFIMTDELSKFLTEWSNNNPRKKMEVSNE